MKKFILRFLAGIGAVTILLSLLVMAALWSWSREETPVTQAPDKMVLQLDFTKPITESTRGMNLSLPALIHGMDEQRFYTLLHALDRAQDDPRVKAVVARFGTERPSLAHAQELRTAIQKLREKGKPTYAFGATYGDFGPGNTPIYLASAFEQIWVQPVGAVGLSGIGTESFFGKSALESIGVRADFYRREEYKSVMENVTRDSYSPTVRANLESLLKDLGNQIAQGVADSRALKRDDVRALMAQGPYTSNEAEKAKIVTRVGYDDELMKEVETKFGKDASAVDSETYLSFTPAPKQPDPKATIAFINAQGLITDDPNAAPNALAEDEIIDTDEIVQAFYDASHNDDIKAILFRVNSPGGSPAASETIRRAVVKAKESGKPVFVSMGDVAASGGYWISMNADHIVAAPGTLTGSIGVVVGKVVVGGLLDKLGIKRDSIMLDENANLWSITQPFSAAGKKKIDALLDETYATFTSNVAAARKIPQDKIRDLAGGRVYTGLQAQQVGLVDEIGGLYTTLDAIKKKLDLKPDDRIAVHLYPAPETTLDMLTKALRNLGLNLLNLQSAARLLSPLTTLTHPPLSTTLPSDFRGLTR